MMDLTTQIISYGRTAVRLIESGQINPDGTINEEHESD